MKFTPSLSQKEIINLSAKFIEESIKRSEEKLGRKLKPIELNLIIETGVTIGFKEWIKKELKK